MSGDRRCSSRIVDIKTGQLVTVYIDLDGTVWDGKERRRENNDERLFKLFSDIA